ncbi:AzlC family ABC transporter permease [Bacillus salinus]|uniref:AzlC family ABC transporter permease n=1 Tax=Bacillus sp. HMF5848 TaxID=2495421 RepID=UPI0021ADCC7D|nr:AzlC family ABC transporter permease [Bacillus sp. HMF5848]
MSTEAITVKHSNFRQGLQAGLSIAIGYMPIALTFGLLAKATGLTVYETVFMSLAVFAGAAQYIALSLLTLGTSGFEIVLTTFIVNIRHFLMSASLSEKVDDDPIEQKALYAFGITDETFTVAATKPDTVSAGYMFGLTLISYTSWVINSGIGHLVGSSLPETIQASMAVALYAMFIGLLMPSLKKSRKVVVLASLAAMFNSMLTLLTPLSPGWCIVLATLTSAIAVEWLMSKYVRKGYQYE